MPSKTNYRIGNPSLLKEINLSVIVNHLRTYGPTSRADLAKAVGLTKATVSSLATDLLQNGFVREGGLVEGQPGRRPMLLEINPDAGRVISAELGVDFISVVITDFASEVIWKTRIACNEHNDPDVGIQCLLSTLEQAHSTIGDSSIPVLGISVGVPGLVDPQTGTLILAPNLGWRHIPILQILKDRFSEPVFVYNESYLGALGEFYCGVGEGYTEMLYIAADVGLGGTIVHNGTLFGGAVAFPGRFGHMIMDPDGALCACGNHGCWETQVSKLALIGLVRQQLENGADGAQVDDYAGGVEPVYERILEAARQGDAVCLAAFRQVGHYLGIGIASLVNALNPAVVVLGNYLSEAGEFLLPTIQEELRAHVVCWNESQTDVLLAQHGYDACIVGGIEVATQAILPEPDAVLRPDPHNIPGQASI